jgi:hypothetical protein
LLDFISNDDSNESPENNNDDNPLNVISGAWDDVEQDASDAFDDVANDVIDEAIDVLDISEWYSLHVMTTCEGRYKPDHDDAELDVTQCSGLTSNSKRFDLPSKLPTKVALPDRLDLISSLNHYLSLSPIQIDVEVNDIGWLEDIQDAINIVNSVLRGLFALHVLIIGMIMLSIVTYIVASLARTSMLMTLNLLSFTLATLCSIVSSIMVTVALSRGINSLNDVGSKVGIRAERGSNFLTLTWLVSGFMIGANLFALLRRNGKNTAPRFKMVKPQGF